MNNFDSFYFLHIPKTGGHFIENKIIYPISGYFVLNNIKHIKGHQYWYPVKEKTYTVSCFRDPVKRTISSYCHTATHIDPKLDVTNIKSMMKWIESNSQYLSNFQTKSLVYDKKPKIDWYLLTDKDFLLLETNKEEIEKQIKKLNMFFKIETLTEKNIIDAKMLILKTFNIKTTENVIKNAKLGNKLNDNINNNSKILYKNISKIEKKYIESINQVDYEFYDSESYFNNFDVY
jgi:hypothetical protein